jgi:hypothetical protein
MCKEYISKFGVLSSQIPGYSNEEAFLLISQQVPHTLAAKLQRLSTKRRLALKVKIIGLTNVNIAQVKALVESLMSAPPNRVYAHELAHVVEVPSVDTRDELLLLNGRMVQGQGIIMVIPFLDSPSIKECLDFILQEVGNDELVEENRRNLQVKAYVVQSHKEEAREGVRFVEPPQNKPQRDSFPQNTPPISTI